MNKWMKRTSAALATLAVLGVTAALAGKYMGERKLQRVIKVVVQPVPVNPSPAALAQGRYLFSTRGCADCHGPTGAGKEVINSGNMLIVSPNISPGANSVTSGYTATDWVRTLRHGVKPDGTPIMIMPSEDYARLTDEDLASIIAYVTQLAPVPGQPRTIRLPFVVKVMYGYGAIRDAAEIIDHTLAPEQPVKAEVSIAHGKYVAHSCVGCHGATLSGGRIPGSPPEWPATANLTPGQGSAMVRYPTPEVFTTMLRSGTRPDGTPISSVMPFGSLKQMNDTDVHALHAYLKTLPPHMAGGR